MINPAFPGGRPPRPPCLDFNMYISCGSYGVPMDKSFGKPMDILWTSYWNFVEIVWTSNGHPFAKLVNLVEILSTSCGHLIDTLWNPTEVLRTSYGNPMAILWQSLFIHILLKPYGHPMDIKWALCNPMGILWKSSGHQLESYWNLVESYGNPMAILWTSYVNMMEVLWKSYGHTMDILWASYDNL